MRKQTVIKSDESLILTAPVMIPGVRDCDYHRGEKIFTAEEVKAFKESYDDYGFIDKYHTISSVRRADKDDLVAHALKSFLLPEETSYIWLDGTVHTYPEGTWMLTSEVSDPNTIQQIEAGLIEGYSPSIFERGEAELIQSALKSTSLKSSWGGLIKNMIDPQVALVSLVRKPCQRGNKFCKINGETMGKEKEAQSKLEKIKKIFDNDPEEQYALKEDLDEMKEEMEAAFKSQKDEIVSDIKTLLEDALKQPSLKGDDGDDDDDNNNGDGEDGNPEPPEDDNNVDPTPEEDDDDENGEGEGDPSLKSEGNGSKKLPLQGNGGKSKPALKSDTAIILDIMGRDKKGRPLKE